jgi:hypothetical protein
MDHIRECNEFKITETDFVKAWCSRCLREDCTRAIKGKSRFEARTSTWQERLFTDVPRLAENDPRYPSIVAKMFQETPGRPAEIRGWDAPEPAAPETPPAPPIPTTPVSQLVKSPNQSGKILGTAPAGWSPKEAVIRPGTRIRIGGSGVGEGSNGST